jgi:hypothetical protein
VMSSKLTSSIVTYTSPSEVLQNMGELRSIRHFPRRTNLVGPALSTICDFVQRGDACLFSPSPGTLNNCQAAVPHDPRTIKRITRRFSVKDGKNTLPHRREGISPPPHYPNHPPTNIPSSSPTLTLRFRMASQLGLVHKARRALYFENTKVACQWHQVTRMVINTKSVDRTNTTKSRGPQLIKINGNNFAGSQRKSADKNLTTPTIPPRTSFSDAK